MREKIDKIPLIDETFFFFFFPPRKHTESVCVLVVRGGGGGRNSPPRGPGGLLHRRGRDYASSCFGDAEHIISYIITRYSYE